MEERASAKMSKPNYLELPLWEDDISVFPKEACAPFLSCILHSDYAGAHNELNALCISYPEAAKSPKVARLYKDFDFILAHF
jgi:hypothetical protein